MPIEETLVASAGGDFVATLAAVLALFIMGMAALLIRWVMITIPQQMREDRQAICDKLTEVMTNNNEKFALIIAAFEKQSGFWSDHDKQARDIKTNLDNRPCAIKK